jgi:hypothetical protein
MTDETQDEGPAPDQSHASHSATPAGPSKPEPSYNPRPATDDDLIMPVERGLQIVQEGDPVKSLHGKKNKS